MKRKKLYALGSKHRYDFDLPLSEIISIGNHDYPVRFKEDDKYGTYLLWKNRRYPVEIVQSRQNKYEILFNYISYSFTIETPFSLKRKKFLNKELGKSDRENIVAPMPGKIIDVMVREGEEINSGDALLILEAMKMQNEIQSTVSGVVNAVNIRPGINVMKDDIMIEIKIS